VSGVGENNDKITVVRKSVNIIIIIIIIIQNLCSAMMPLGGYRGADGTGR